jgi:hypothetical protein
MVFTLELLRTRSTNFRSFANVGMHCEARIVKPSSSKPKRVESKHSAVLKELSVVWFRDCPVGELELSVDPRDEL